MMAGKVRRLLPMVRDDGEDDPERASVLDAAFDAFLDFGVKRTSMGEIAKRVKLSPATLYRRFAAKSDLVQALGLREVRRFLADVDRRIDTSASADEQITELYVAMTTGLHRHRLLRRLLDTEPDIMLPKLTTEGFPVIELGRDYLVEFIHRLQREGKLPDYNPEPFAEILARAALTLALTPHTSVPLKDDDAARQFVRTHILPAFGLPNVAVGRRSGRGTA
jgi:AcrR family transcriptional regulator